MQGEGNDGKTILFKALFPGQLLGIANDDDILRNDKFMFANIWDRPATLVGDSKAVNLMMLGTMHRLTGRDKIGVEYKHGARFTAEYQGVVFVSSNAVPNIEGTRANLSRLTIVQFEKGPWKDDLENLLRQELPALLHRARDAYAVRCPRHFDIELNARSQELLEEATGNETDTWTAALAFGGFKFEAEAWTSRAELLKILKITDAQRKSLYHWLKRQPGVTEVGRKGLLGFKGLKKG